MVTPCKQNTATVLVFAILYHFVTKKVNFPEEGGGGGGKRGTHFLEKKWKIWGGGGEGSFSELPSSVVGVWIFSGTTHFNFFPLFGLLVR